MSNPKLIDLIKALKIRADELVAGLEPKFETDQKLINYGVSDNKVVPITIFQIAGNKRLEHLITENIYAEELAKLTNNKKYNESITVYKNGDITYRNRDLEISFSLKEPSLYFSFQWLCSPPISLEQLENELYLIGIGGAENDSIISSAFELATILGEEIQVYPNPNRMKDKQTFAPSQEIEDAVRATKAIIEKLIEGQNH